MVERVVMAISYRRLMNYLADDMGYEERRAKRTIAALRRAEPSILKAFLIWFYTGDFPRESLYGINVKALCDRRGLDPVTAFLTVDWAARDPQSAKTALSRGHDALVFSEEDQKHFQEIMDRNGWEIENTEQETEEDESDLSLAGKELDDSTAREEEVGYERDGSDHSDERSV